jgi:hypothetical protein
MAHFAQVDEYNIVRNVIVIDNSDCGGGDYPDSEPIGQAFIASIGIDGDWLQTSYNNNFRGQYAGQGMTYDPTLDEFISPQTEEPLSE